MEPVSDPAHPRPFHRLDYGQMLQGVLGAFAEPRLDADPAQFGDYARAGNARVDEQMPAVATRVDAVAAGAAEERRKAKFQ